MHSVFRSGAVLPLGTTRAFALPARWASQRIPSVRKLPTNHFQNPHATILRPPPSTCPQCRHYTTATSVAPGELTESWDGFENTYEDAPRPSQMKKPTFKESWRTAMENDHSVTDTQTTLMREGSSKKRRMGKYRHQIIRPPNQKYKDNRAFIPFFDYKEWGYLRHQYAPEDLQRYRTMHRKWKSQCQDVLMQRWQEKFQVPGTRELADCTDADQMAAIWEGLKIDEQLANGTLHKRWRDALSVWRPIALSLMTKRPERAVMFLEATTRGTWKPPGFIIADVMRLAGHSVGNMESGPLRTSIANYFVDVTMAMIHRTETGYTPWRQNDFFHLQKHATNDKVLEFYMLLLERQIPVHHNTMAQMAYRFALETAYKPYAMRIIYETLTGLKGIEKQSSWAKICTVIFLPSRHDGKDGHDEGDNGTMAQEMWAALIPAGFTPNLIHFTALIRYLSHHGQMDTAWKVFEVVVEHDIPPDSVFYATMLDGAKKRMDTESFHRALALISESNSGNATVWNTVMHLVVTYAMNEAYQKGLDYPRVIPVFTPLLEIYSRIFDMAPLQKLLPPGFTSLPSDLMDWRFADLLHPVHMALPDPEKPKLQPTTATLVIMLLAYLRNVPKGSDVITFYGNFRNLYLAGDETAGQLVKEQRTLVYDMVMKALSQWPTMLRLVVDVFNDLMTEGSVDSKGAGTEDDANKSNKSNKSNKAKAKKAKEAIEAEKVNGANGVKESENETVNLSKPNFHHKKTHPPKTPVHPRPSIYSWSILLHAWLTHRAGAPDSVTRLMATHGIVPTLVTWNTLIAGYSRMQMGQEVVDSLQGLHQAGLRPDGWTLRAFSRLRSREAVMGELRRAIEMEVRAEREGPAM